MQEGLGRLGGLLPEAGRGVPGELHQASARDRTLASLKWDLTTLIPGPLGTNPLNGAWSTLSNYSAEVTNFLGDAFSSAWDGLVGNPGVIEQAGGASMTGASAGGAGLTQMLMNGANDILSSISPDLAAAIFTTANNGNRGCLYRDGAVAHERGSFITWLYTIYNILDILVHIIWACEQSELELGAKQQLKVCHYVGAYCASDVIGICIEKQDSYCCYDSPLARIMQEQIRKQGVEGGWGSAKHPKCGGLYTTELEGSTGMRWI